MAVKLHPHTLYTICCIMLNDLISLARFYRGPANDIQANGVSKLLKGQLAITLASHRIFYVDKKTHWCVFIPFASSRNKANVTVTSNARLSNSNVTVSRSFFIHLKPAQMEHACQPRDFQHCNFIGSWSTHTYSNERLIIYNKMEAHGGKETIVQPIQSTSNINDANYSDVTL